MVGVPPYEYVVPMRAALPADLIAARESKQTWEVRTEARRLQP
jgi:hypothetical protein